MALVRAQVALAASNGLPEDVTVNTFHFSTGDVASSTLDDIASALTEFYTVVPIGPPAGANALYSFFSTEVAQNGHVIKFYNLDEDPPRVPMQENTFNLPTAPNGDALPGEVACVLSFQATPQSGLSQARRRGRIFLGRLDKDSSTAGRPSSALMGTLASAGEDLLGLSDGAALWTWIVYSAPYDGMVRDVDGNLVPHPTRSAYPETFAPVANGWVDNAFDTQRRRGLAATARTLWP